MTKVMLSKCYVAQPMRTILLIALSLIQSSLLAQVNVEPIKPIFVLMDSSPTGWKQLNGFTTSAVLYDNGQIIYRKMDSKNVLDYKTSILDSTTFSEWVNDLKDLQFHDFENSYEPNIGTGYVTHQIPVKMYYFLSRYPLDLTLEEDLRGLYEQEYFDAKYGDGTYKVKNYYPTDWIPRKLLLLYEKLIHFEDSAETTWIPQEYELTLSSRGGKKAIDWPEHWPKNSDFEYIHDGIYKVLIPSDELSTYLNMLQNDKNLFQVERKKYSTEIRITFPLESYWLN